MEYVPVPVIVIECSGEFLHLVDGNGETDEDERECCRIQPMIVSVELFLAGINSLLMGLKPLLVDDTLHSLHILVFDKILLVDLVVDEVSEEEGDGHGSYKCNGCSPDDHGRTKELISVDGCNDDGLDGPVNEYDSRAGKTRVALLMGKVSEGVEGHIGPSVILIVVIVDIYVGTIGAQEE